jgi:hypothetical protein
MSATSHPASTGDLYADLARSIYIRSCIAWAAGYIAETGHPLTHYVALTLLDARARYPDVQNWQFEALARRIKRLMDADYWAPQALEPWSPLPDDPQAWALDADSATQQGCDRWGQGFGQGDY